MITIPPGKGSVTSVCALQFTVGLSKCNTRPLILCFIIRSTCISPENCSREGWYNLSNGLIWRKRRASTDRRACASDGRLWLVVAGSAPLRRRYVNTAADDQSFYYSAKLFSTLFEIIFAYLFRRVRSYDTAVFISASISSPRSTTALDFVSDVQLSTLGLDIGADMKTSVR